jgi:predicted acylesterase/phospholipase RssA
MALRVLSLDGGGIRGIVPARVLAELEQVTGTPVAQLFDLVAGTAAGGVLALGLAAPGADGAPRFRSADLLRLFVDRGHELFPQPDPSHRLRHFYGWRRAQHPAARPLGEQFGDTPLGDALVELIIPTYDLTAAAPLLLRSDEFAAGLGPSMADVALATSSLPTHYPAVEVEFGARGSGLTHGGLVANNPAPFAYGAALSRSEPEDVVIVSIGTGARGQNGRNGSAAVPNARWPASAARSFELQLECASEAQHQMLDAILASTGRRESYWRIQPSLEPHPHDHGLSDPVALSHLADEFVTGMRPTVNEIADRLAA